MIPNKIRLAWPIVFFISSVASLLAQNDTTFNEMQKEFSDFQEEADSEMHSFLSENDSLFLRFLQQSWEEYKVYEIDRDEKPKPMIQPVLTPESDYDSAPDFKGEEIQVVPASKINSTEPGIVSDVSEIQFQKPEEYESLAIVKSFELFGAEFMIQCYPDRMSRVESITERGIQDYYRIFADQSDLWNSNLVLLLEKKEFYRFNDWGYYLILQEAARQIFEGHNEQLLFVWYAMINCGYIVKIAYSGDKLFLLIPSKHELYNIPFLIDKGLKYYLFGSHESPKEVIKTYPGFHTDSARIFSFSFTQVPLISNTEQLVKTLTWKNREISISFQKGLLDYLGSMPQSALSLYYSLPLSAESMKELDALLSPILQGKTARQKVDLLLEFIQTAIPYTSDRAQFGAEHYLFAEECLYYPGADCEDRTVLLKQLVMHYTGLPALSLEYESHVTLAVHFPDAAPGDYVMHNGKKYTICDPTFINARAGMLPADLKDQRPEIRVLE